MFLCFPNKSSARGQGCFTVKSVFNRLILSCYNVVLHACIARRSSLWRGTNTKSIFLRYSFVTFMALILNC
jgi:hypothetical protein